jgi:hypothetical protein
MSTYQDLMSTMNNMARGWEKERERRHTREAHVAVASRPVAFTLIFFRPDGVPFLFRAIGGVERPAKAGI